MDGKISVIIPVYNVEKYLKACVDSVINQTYKNLEIILIDDGSTDKSGKICDEYKDKDSRIKVIHKENGGLSDARNKGLDIASGDYITFLDSDDKIAANFVKEMYNALILNSVHLSVCGFNRNSGGYSEPETAADFEVLSAEEYFVKFMYSVCATAKLYKKELFNDIRFPKGKLHEDEFTTYKAIFKCDKIAVTDSELYSYYTNPDSIMNSAWSPGKTAAVEAKEEQLEFFLKIKNRQLAKRALIQVMQCANNQINLADKEKNKKEIAFMKKKAKKNYLKHKNLFDKSDKEKYGYLIKTFLPLRYLFL